MSDKRTAPTASEGASRPKRATPTIDLTATDVSPSPAEPASHETKDESSSDEATPASGKEAPDTMPSERVKGAGGNRFAVAMLAAAFFCAAAVFIAAIVFWFGYVLPSRDTNSADMGAKITALEKQVRDLQNRPAVNAAMDKHALDALAVRVTKIEGDAAQRLQAAENAMQSLGVALSALNKRSDNIAGDVSRALAQAEAAQEAVTQLRGGVQQATKEASAAVDPAQFSGLQQRISTLEQSIKDTRAGLSKIASAEKSTRLALSAAELNSTVANGRPFQAQLQQAKSLGVDNKTLMPLEPFAATGVPSAAALSQELRTLLPTIQKAAGTPEPSGGFLQRLQSNAARLVRVQPVNAPAGDDISAVLARLNIDANASNVSAALADLAKLPEGARAPAQVWIEKAQARAAALAAARSLVADATRAMGPE